MYMCVYVCGCICVGVCTYIYIYIYIKNASIGAYIRYDVNNGLGKSYFIPITTSQGNHEK